MGIGKKQHIITAAIHATAWLLLFLLPIIIFQYTGTRHMPLPAHLITLPLTFLIAFYANYFYLTDHFLFNRKTGQFLLLNLLLIILLCLGLYLMHLIPHPAPGADPMAPPRPHTPFIVFVLRDAASIICFIGLSVGLKTIMKWKRLEDKNRKLEQERAEAELKNLKNQLNPHFLFNTLNNIYVLIAVNSDRAQEAVLELSRLLRYVLYENKERYVPLSQELNFLHDYIELMRLRQNKQTRIDVHIDAGGSSNYSIAPLLFIPLIENAFKHGIDPICPSFIDIDITAPQEGIICCRVRNSYFPKDSADHSGSGIGLDNIRRQLELLYPKTHTLVTTCSDNIYTATLTIDLHKTTEI